MEDIRKRIFVAALLHDIGKFYQRADRSLMDMGNELSEEPNFGYQHTVWTHKFLLDKASLLKRVPGLIENNSQLNADSVFKLAEFHHKPSTELQAIISLADCWSAGSDRRLTNLEADSGDAYGVKWGNKRYKRIPLYSVFNKIFEKDYHCAFGLHPLSINGKNIFSSDVKVVEDGVNEDEYFELWKEFSEEFDKLPTDSFVGFEESLMFLLKKYTWCVPSNTTDMANVSLFDHLKTTAAFADCLYVYQQSNPTALNFANGGMSINSECCPVILLGGDVSGIQKFIYNIASRKAAVSLKGRSFYLQLLIDSIIQRVISHPEINVTLSHVVYSSGGKFYMILPNTDKVKTSIGQLKEEFECFLWKEHHGQLIFNMDFIPFAYDINGRNIKSDTNIEIKTIGELWQALAEKLTSQKNQKFKSLLKNQYDTLFDIKNVGGKHGVCAVTGIESSDLVPIDPMETEKTYVLRAVKQQAELGQTLKDTDFVVTFMGNGDNTFLSNRSKCHISCAGVDNYLFDQEELTKDDADFRRISSVDVYRVKRINETSFIVPIEGNSCGYGFQFYGGNKQATTFRGDNKTFEELADHSYLGVLRMDVDNLGSIFINGLPEEDKSFSAYSTLSFMLDYFFSGYLNTIRQRDDFKDDVNILYSGGDDVFAIGKWNKLIEFAENIREAFRKFVGRDDISISGGIAVVGDKFPIAKSAELAGDAEDAAKKYNNSAKNAFCMFGESVAWNSDEYIYVKNFKNKFVYLISSCNMSRGILHKLMEYYEMMKRGNVGYLWHSVYYLTRYMGKRDDNEAVYDFCKNLRDNELVNPEKFRLVALAARWAELELRFLK